MKIEEQCVICSAKLILDEKDIKPLSDYDKKRFEELKNNFRNEFQKKTTRRFFGKDVPLYSEKTQKFILSLERYGTIKCPVCKSEQYLTRQL